MNNDLISRSELKRAINDFYDEFFDGCFSSALITYAKGVDEIIENAPTVEVPENNERLQGEYKTAELKPLVEKVVEILPELTDAIIKELPKMVSGKIKCSECSYYTNTFNGEWVRKEDLIHYIATQYIDHNELVPIWLSIGDMKGGTE